MSGSDYIDVNRRNWESRVPIHEQGYGLDDFRRDPAHLSGVVRFDLPRLGDVAGVDTVHLQCHIGTDTLSLAYVEHVGELASPDTIQWNHGLAEIITAVADGGLRVVAIEEHSSVPWNPLGGAMEALPNGEYQLRERPERLAATYTLQAVKS